MINNRKLKLIFEELLPQYISIQIVFDYIFDILQGDNILDFEYILEEAYIRSENLIPAARQSMSPELLRKAINNLQDKIQNMALSPEGKILLDVEACRKILTHYAISAWENLQKYKKKITHKAFLYPHTISKSENSLMLSYQIPKHFHSFQVCANSLKNTNARSAQFALHQENISCASLISDHFIHLQESIDTAL